MSVSLLASVFSAHGSYVSRQAFTDGLSAAMPFGAAVLAGRAGRAARVPGPRARAGRVAGGVEATEQAVPALAA